MSSIEQVRQEIEAKRKELSDLVKAEIPKVFEKFFGEFPEVKAVVWQQYTPFFNDGDTCTFSIHEVYFCQTVPDQHPEEYGVDEENRPFSTYDYADSDDGDKRVSKELHDGMNSLEHFIYGNSDIFKEAYGDHVSICVTREDVSVDEYDHD